jgi:hypothetical protein
MPREPPVTIATLPASADTIRPLTVLVAPSALMICIQSVLAVEVYAREVPDG